MRTISYLIQYVTLRMSALIASILPYRAALCFGWINALLSYVLAGSRVKKAKERIREVFGDKISQKKINRIAWLSWRNLVFSGIEMVRVPGKTEKWARSTFDFSEAVETLKRNHEKTGKGAILAGPHMGSWELATMALNLCGINAFGISGRQRNPFVNSYMKKLRTRQGLKNLVRGDENMTNVIPMLKSGMALGILPDVRVRMESIEIDFLGGKANLGRGLALFAKLANVPVYPCAVTRTGWTKHKAVVYEPIWPDNKLDKEEDIRRITEYVIKHIEQNILEEPEQWFWYNKRWVLDPI